MTNTTNAIRVPRDNITRSPGRPFPRRFFQPGFSPTTRCMHARESSSPESQGGFRVALAPRLTCVGVASPLARSLARSPSDSLTCTSTRGSIWRATDCSRVPGDPVYNSGRSRPCRAARSQSRPSRFSPRDERHPRNRAVAGVVQPSVLQTFYPPLYLLASDFNPPEITSTRMAIAHGLPLNYIGSRICKSRLYFQMVNVLVHFRLSWLKKDIDFLFSFFFELSKIVLLSYTFHKILVIML